MLYFYEGSKRAFSKANFECKFKRYNRSTSSDVCIMSSDECRNWAKAFLVVGHAVKACLSLRTMLQEEIMDRIQSGAGSLHIYSAKLPKFLSTSPFSFYQLHVTLLNFTEHVRLRLIVDGSTVVAYLPMSYLNSGFVSSQRIKQVRNVAILR